MAGAKTRDIYAGEIYTARLRGRNDAGEQVKRPCRPRQRRLRLLVYADADYGRQHVQAMPTTAKLRWRRMHARTRPRQRRQGPVVHTVTDWILYLEKKNSA